MDDLKERLIDIQERLNAYERRQSNIFEKIRKLERNSTVLLSISSRHENVLKELRHANNANVQTLSYILDRSKHSELVSFDRTPLWDVFFTSPTSEQSREFFQTEKLKHENYLFYL